MPAVVSFEDDTVLIVRQGIRKAISVIGRSSFI